MVSIDCETDVAAMGFRGRNGLLCGLLAGLLIGPAATAQPPSDPWVTPSRAVTVEAPFAASSDSEMNTPRRLPSRDAAEVPVASSRSAGLPKAASLWGTVGALVVIAAGVLVAAKWIRRNGPAVMRALPNEAVEPLGQRVLSRGVAVHLVRCGGQMLLLGVGPDGVRTLATINDPEEIEQLSAACRRRDESSLKIPAFSQFLKRHTSTAAEPSAGSPLQSLVGRSVGSITEVDGV